MTIEFQINVTEKDCEKAVAKDSENCAIANASVRGKLIVDGKEIPLAKKPYVTVKKFSDSGRSELRVTDVHKNRHAFELPSFMESFAQTLDEDGKLPATSFSTTLKSEEPRRSGPKKTHQPAKTTKKTTKPADRDRKSERLRQWSKSEKENGNGK